MMREHCANCHFGVRRLGVLFRGPEPIECHKKAPVSVIENIGSRQTGSLGDMAFMEPIKGPVAKWPIVQPDDFCGEWELQDAK